MSQDEQQISGSIPRGISPQDLGFALRHWLVPQETGKSVPPCALSISGDWGSGKTFWWNNYRQGTPFKSVYVSLFGVDSLASLEQRLLSEAVGVTGEVEESRVKKSFEALGKVVKIGADSLGGSSSTVGNLFGALSGYVGEVMRDAAYGQLTGYVVAIDDLERRSASLSMEQVLGFVSRLRELWKVSVLLILNEKELGKDLELLQRFREKVIDCDYRFAIDADTAATIGLTDNSWAIAAASEFGNEVTLTNIRIYQRVNSVLNRLGVDYSALPRAVQAQVARSTTLLCWSHFVRSTEIPTVEQFLTFSSMAYEIARQSGDHEKVPPRPFETTLLRVNWAGDLLDKLIADVVVTGNIPTSAVTDRINACLADNARAEAKEKFQAIRTQYRSTLQDQDDLLIELIRTTFGEFKQYASVADVSSAAWLLGVLDLPEEAKKLIDDQVEFWRKSELSFESLNEYPFDLEPYLREAIQGESHRPIFETVDLLFDHFVAHEHAWNRKVERSLPTFTQAAWQTFLEKKAHESLVSVLQRIRQAYSALPKTEASPKEQCESTLDAALKALQHRSKANKRLVPALLGD